MAESLAENIKGARLNELESCSVSSFDECPVLGISSP